MAPSSNNLFFTPSTSTKVEHLKIIPSEKEKKKKWAEKISTLVSQRNYFFCVCLNMYLNEYVMYDVLPKRADRYNQPGSGYCKILVLNFGWKRHDEKK